MQQSFRRAAVAAIAMASLHVIKMYDREWWPNIMCELGLPMPEMTKWWQTLTAKQHWHLVDNL